MSGRRSPDGLPPRSVAFDGGRRGKEFGSYSVIRWIPKRQRDCSARRATAAPSNDHCALASTRRVTATGIAIGSGAAARTKHHHPPRWPTRHQPITRQEPKASPFRLQADARCGFSECKTTPSEPATGQSLRPGHRRASAVPQFLAAAFDLWFVSLATGFATRAKNFIASMRGPMVETPIEKPIRRLL
jgi:hypothetical protein